MVEIADLLTNHCNLLKAASQLIKILDAVWLLYFVAIVVN